MKIQGVGPNQGIERSKSEYRNQRCTRRCRLEREVRANLPYRAFARTGDGKVPDAKERGQWRDWDKPSGRSNRASGAWCKEEGATVVETNIHTATDSCLLGDGARVLMQTRRLPRSKKKPRRDRMRSLRSEGTVEQIAQEVETPRECPPMGQFSAPIRSVRFACSST